MTRSRAEKQITSASTRFPQHKESEPRLIIQHYVKECIMVLYNR